MSYDHNVMQQDAQSLQEAILAILQHHVGANRAIKAADIAHSLGRRGKYADRPIREAIKTLRRDGYLILSSIREPYGYFLAATESEWQDFRDTNLRPRALDILETAKAMSHAAQRQWGATAAIIQLNLDLVA